MQEDNRQEINTQATGVYVHIPFCRKKCLYCDFYSGGGRNTDWQRFAESLVRELKERKGELAEIPSTLYIGGGTPSLMPEEQFSFLVEEICRVTGKTDPWDEFTIEVNPEDVTPDSCRMWLGCGVNRVSMGVQTLNDNELKRIGRNHDSGTALSAIEILRKNFENFTIDLIFGLPEQTSESWRDTVERIIAVKPPHISAYSLMFEEGTALTLLREQGRLSFPTEEECVEMWQYLQRRLNDEGYVQYELSNYSLPGRESLHNRRYWLGNPYLGIGPSAHSYDGKRVRRANKNDIKGYMAFFGKDGDLSKKGYSEISVNSGGDDGDEFDENSHKDGSIAGSGTFYIEERLSQEELKEEMIMLSMRMKRGLDLDRFKCKFGEEAFERLMRNSKGLLKERRVVIAEGMLRLTTENMMVADDIILELCM